MYKLSMVILFLMSCSSNGSKQNNGQEDSGSIEEDVGLHKDSGFSDQGADSTKSNTAPVAYSFKVEVKVNNKVRIELNGRDEEDKDLSFSVTKSPTHGVFDKGVYTPNLDYVGKDEVRYIANDGELDSDEAKVSIDVIEEVNHAPKALKQDVSVEINNTLKITLAGQDADGDEFTIEITDPPNHGVFVNDIYTPSTDYFGDDSLSFRVNDGKLKSMKAKVRIKVLGPKDIIAAAKLNYSEVGKIHERIKKEQACQPSWSGKDYQKRFALGFHNNFLAESKALFLPAYSVFGSPKKGLTDQQNFDRFVNASEDQVHDIFQRYIYEVADLEHLRSEDVIIILDIETFGIPSQLGERGYSDDEIKAHADAYNMRLKVVRSYFLKARLAIYGVVVLTAIPSPGGVDTAYTQQSMLGLNKAGTMGLFDHANYLSPVQYARRGPNDFTDTSIPHYLNYINDWMQLHTEKAISLRKSNGKKVCVAPIITAVYINGSSDSHNKIIPQSIFSSYMQTYMDHFRGAPDVGPIIFWGHRDYAGYKMKYKLELKPYLENMHQNVH